MSESFQKELVGFEANNDILHITSNNNFIVSYDIDNNLKAYEFQTSKQLKMTVDLPKSKITDIKLSQISSLFVISFENGTLILLDAHIPDKIINKYNYYDSIDEKEKTKLSKANQECFFRNLTFVDSNAFIAVLQKGPINRCREQLFKFAIIPNENSGYSIINYCEYIHFNTDKENHLIGNPLKIFDDSIHITRISSILIFDQTAGKDDQKPVKLPQIVGISLKKKNKFMISTVNGFRFEIIQMFTADNSISSFAYHKGTNRINLAFTSFSFHMIFIKSLTIPSENSQKISITDICTIKLPVIICSNLKSLSFISPDLISIVYTSPGKLNTSIYSIIEGKLIGVLPPVSNSNLYLNSDLAVAATFTNNKVFLISKGSALSFSNKDMTELAEEGKFVPENVDEYVEASSFRSSGLAEHFNALSSKGGEKEKEEGVESKGDEKKAPLKSQNSSRLISFWNKMSEKDETKNLPEKQPRPASKVGSEPSKLDSLIKAFSSGKMERSNEKESVKEAANTRQKVKSAESAVAEAKSANEKREEGGSQSQNKVEEKKEEENVAKESVNEVEEAEVEENAQQVAQKQIEIEEEKQKEAEAEANVQQVAQKQIEIEEEEQEEAEVEANVQQVAQKQIEIEEEKQKEAEVEANVQQVAQNQIEIEEEEQEEAEVEANVQQVAQDQIEIEEEEQEEAEENVQQVVQKQVESESQEASIKEAVHEESNKEQEASQTSTVTVTETTKEPPQVQLQTQSQLQVPVQSESKLSSNLPSSSQEELEKYKSEGKYVAGIECCIGLLGKSNDSATQESIKSRAIDFLNLYIASELQKPNVNVSQLSAQVISYSKRLDVVNEWLLGTFCLTTFSKSGPQFKNFLFSVITEFQNDQKIRFNPLFVQLVAKSCESGFNEGKIQSFLMNLVPQMMHNEIQRSCYFSSYLLYAKNVKNYEFAGDVYCELVRDYSSALRCYEAASKGGSKCVDKMVKIIIDHSSVPSVINWLFACNKTSSNEVSFPRCSTFLIGKSGMNEAQSIQALKSILQTASLYSNSTLVVNALLITFSKEKVDSQNQVYKFVESFIIDSLCSSSNEINAFSKISLEFLLSQILSPQKVDPDNRENLLLSLLNAKDSSGKPLDIFPETSSFLYPLYLKCQTLNFSKSQEAILTKYKETPDFCIQILIDDILAFIDKSLISSKEFDSELSKKRKLLFDYLSQHYVKNENNENRLLIEKVIKKNIFDIVCIFSIFVDSTMTSQNLHSPPPNSPDQFFLQTLLSTVFLEEFVCQLSNCFEGRCDVQSAFIHALILGGIDKSMCLLEIVAKHIISTIPFFVMNPIWKDDIIKFIIIASKHFQDNDIVHECLSSSNLLSVCESHFLFQCCCVLCVINGINDKCIYFLQQLIFSLNAKEFTYSQLCSSMSFNESGDLEGDLSEENDEDDDEFADYSFEESSETILSQYINKIVKVKNNVDIVKITAHKLFNDELQNAWKAFMFLVDVFVNVIKKQSDSIGTYYLEDVMTLYHDICYIMASNEKNNIDFCEIIRVTRESFGCLCESLRNRVIRKTISSQVFAPIAIKTIEKNILERPAHQKQILKYARCAKCKMPLFIDGIGVYMFECGHGVHNLSFCRRNGSKCQLCSNLH